MQKSGSTCFGVCDKKVQAEHTLVRWYTTLAVVLLVKFANTKLAHLVEL